MFAALFDRNGPLTKACERMTLRTIANVASTDTRLSPTERHWFALMRGTDHPKRTFLFFVIISMAAANFWNDIKSPNSQKLFATARKSLPRTSRNPFKSLRSDVVVAETLIFILCNMSDFVRRAVKANEMTEADQDAALVVGPRIRHMIEETTGWTISDVLSLRFSEYGRCTRSNEPLMEAFCAVLVSSIGKQAIHEPDRPIDFRRNDTPLRMYTMAHMAGHCPAYCEVYKDVVEHYSLD